MKQLLDKQVTRKEFLQYTGLALLAVTGVSGILRNLNSIGSNHGQKTSAKPQGSYSSGAYGGKAPTL